MNFVRIGQDIDIEKEAAIIRGKVRNPVLSMLKTTNFVLKIIESSSDDVYKVWAGKDLITISHSQMGATKAEILGIKMVNVTLQTKMIPQALKKQTFVYKLFGGFIAGPYNKIRKKYGLKPAKDIGKSLSDKLGLIPISTYVKPRNPYWEPLTYSHRLLVSRNRRVRAG